MKNDLLSRTMSCSVADVVRLRFESNIGDCKHLYLPDFQRPFVWTTTDIQELLDDIDELRSIPGAPVGEETYRDDEYYLGSICLRPKDTEDQSKGWEVLDGQQRLTSIMLLAKVLYDRARKVKNLRTDISHTIVQIDEQMGPEENWRGLMLYSDPKTVAHIQKIYKELERNYLLLEADSLNNGTTANSKNFYEDTLLRDLQRFLYILKHGRFALTCLKTLRESEQFFQGENNRGLPMSTLDLLKAYHMRFETESERIAKIRELWSRFNEEPNDEPEKDTSTARENARRAARRQQIDYNVLALLLISHSVVPWDYEIKKISHVDKLKGILGTHTRDRVIDEKLEASVGMSRVKDESVKQIGKGIPTPIFDLLDPIHPGLPFFQALDQYLRMSEAIALVLNLSYEALREPDFNQFLHINRDTDLNYDQRLILSIALVAWADRFLPRGALTKSPLEMANTLSQDMEFRAYAHAFARFLDRMRARNYGKEYVGVYSRLSKAALIRVLNFHSIDQNLLLLPHHSTSPAACRRTFMTRTHPDNILTWEAGYRKAFIAESERARNDIKSKK